MWLLRTKDATLHYFVSDEVAGRDHVFGYAILSHVWGEEEQTFQDIQALPDQCAPGQTPRDIASEKIRNACEIAESRCYKWIWIDTCCIDKSSSAELSEAINSMFRYYSLAGMCFVYLEDVSYNDHRSPFPADELKKSKWHTRGWTLQELIAPRVVAFVSRSWMVVGYKSEQRVAELVNAVTGVPVVVVQDSKRMKEFSVAQRMSWAANRKTTRKEDEAYCLLGIFDINMPTLYGEGRKAFRRLQEEIMKQYPDTTLFAWGLHCTWNELVHRRAEDPAGCQDPDYHLFATSPSWFHTCSQLRFVDPMKCLEQTSDTDHWQHDGYITFTSTPHGVSTVIPTLEHENYGHILGHLGWVEGRKFLLLLLQPLSGNLLSKGRLYRIGIPIVGAGRFQFPHVSYAPTSLNDIFLQNSAVATWRKVYLAYDVVAPTMNVKDTFQSVSLVPPDPSLNQLYSPFHFDPRHLPQDPLFTYRIYNSSILEPHTAWIGDPPITFAVDVSWGGQKSLSIRLGVCTRSSSVASSQRVAHWAGLHHELDALKAEHDCSNDHISSWPNLSRKFDCKIEGGFRFQVTLSFTQFEWNTGAGHTLVLHLAAKRVDAFDNNCDIVYQNSESLSGTVVRTMIPVPDRLLYEVLQLS